MSPNNQKHQTKKQPVKKPWKDVQSRPSAQRAKTKAVEPSRLIELFQSKYPDAHCALEYANPFELLIATILSAQCTDERVNQVTRVLFVHFPNPQSMAKAEISDLEAIIRPTGFFRNKAKSLKSCAQQIVEHHSGAVPKTMEELKGLAGVGRKTANVVLGNAFQISSGVVVDTHVTRLSNRFGLVKQKDPVKIEEKLVNLVPKKHWIQFSHWMISHGRKVCKARKPDCQHCFLFDQCPQIGV